MVNIETMEIDMWRILPEPYSSNNLCLNNKTIISVQHIMAACTHKTHMSLAHINVLESKSPIKEKQPHSTRTKVLMFKSYVFITH